MEFTAFEKESLQLALAAIDAYIQRNGERDTDATAWAHDARRTLAQVIDRAEAFDAAGAA